MIRVYCGGNFAFAKWLLPVKRAEIFKIEVFFFCQANFVLVSVEVLGGHY